MKRAILINTLLFFILISAMASAQSVQERQADLLYQNSAYSEAVIIYESLYNHSPNNGKYIQRLAYCYNKMLNYRKALVFYSLLIQTEQRKNEDYYEYSQLLRIDGKMDESKKWLEKYIGLAPNDMRAINQYKKLNELFTLSNNFSRIEIKQVAGNTRFIDMCPIYYHDRIVFSSAKDSFSMITNNYKWNDQPFLNLFVTKPNPKSDFKGSTEFSSKLNSRVHEGPACFTFDYKIIYFTRNSSISGKSKKSPNGVNNLKIFISTFDGRNWSTARDFPYNSKDYSVGHPALSPDNKTLYFVSDMPGGFGETDIYKSEWINGQWSKPENLGATINTEGKEMFPFVDKTGTLYFSSDGHPGISGLDIYIAKEEERGKYLVTNIGNPLNSKYDDFGFIINPDSLNGYFTSNRPGGSGDDDIYSFSVAVSAIDLTVTCMKEENREILPGTKVYLKSESGEVISSAICDQDGKVEFSVKPGAKYQLFAEKSDYVADVKHIVISSQLFGFHQKEEILLKRNYSYLSVKVIDKESGLVIPNAKVDVSEGKFDQAEFKNNNGVVRMKLNELTNYKFDASAMEYFGNSAKFTGANNAPGEYSLTIELEKMSVGKQFVLNDLYYDLDKSNIRPDAALILDRLVKILLDNPTIRIEIGSHTDCRATAAYNKKLSQRRSESVLAYLISKGIAPNRLEAKDYGESQLVNRCSDGVECSEEEHQANRRTVVKILNKEIRKVKLGNKDTYTF